MAQRVVGDMTYPPYKIVVLNGTSSSGKTSIARALQACVEEVWLNFSIDSVLYALPESELNATINGQLIGRTGYEYEAMEQGYWHSVVALAQQGNRVIADNALVLSSQKSNVTNLLSDHACLWVGVHCSLEELKCRERARGDRAIGTAERQFKSVHVEMEYDLEVDTGSDTVQAIAEVITARLVSA